MFRFYGELNDFLPNRRRYNAFSHTISGRVSVKDVIESLGVPHPEIGLLLVNSQSVDFSYLVQDTDFISVYPAFAQLDVKTVSRVQPEPLAEFRFVLDVHLGTLATYLRLFGFDTLYRNDYSDEELACISHTEGRMLLTRDRGLLMRSLVEYGYFVRHTNPKQQLVEILHRFRLTAETRPFERCLTCNGLLEPIAKEIILAQLPPKVREGQDLFWRCRQCGQVYWRGTHHERMQRFIDAVNQKLISE
ncbi:Mut7-C ubiquitin/RNAse domain-containing protein [Spirosoma taeanense]|nr:Mut7-C ubiquitin/RNAse domain-containing protein [Spirosoma taeanense]